jgi:hypothetical protein
MWHIKQQQMRGVWSALNTVSFFLKSHISIMRFWILSVALINSAYSEDWSKSILQYTQIQFKDFRSMISRVLCFEIIFILIIFGSKIAMWIVRGKLSNKDSLFSIKSRILSDDNWISRAKRFHKNSFRKYMQTRWFSGLGLSWTHFTI